MKDMSITTHGQWFLSPSNTNNKLQVAAGAEFWLWIICWSLGKSLRLGC